MKIRDAKFAGSWYTDDRRDLQSTIEEMLNKVEVDVFYDKIYGLIVPHAAYQFSGNTAASAYKQLIGRAIDRVIILSPNHRDNAGPFISVTAEAYRSPLGDVSVDLETVGELVESGVVETVDDDQEHAIEIQLPFLQNVLGSFEIVPIMVGMVGSVQMRGMQDALRNITGLSGSLLVASSDLYHEYSYDDVIQKDHVLVKAIEKWDRKKVNSLLNAPGCTVCGRVPIQLAVETAFILGAKKVEVLHHTTSGDITGRKEFGEYTVGYLSAVMV